MLPRAAAAVLLCAPIFTAQGAKPDAHSPAVDARAQAGDAKPAATGRDATLSFEELDGLLIERHAMSEDGRAALKHLLNARVLDSLARESKLTIGAAEVDARIAQIERDMAASGQKGGLPEYLKQNHVPSQTFREFLRLGLVQETLARRALGIADGRPVNADQQEMWLAQVMASRGMDFPPPPWVDSIAARCGEMVVTQRELASHLRTQIARDTVREDCFQALLEKRLQSRMPDLSEEALGRAVDAELARRRADFAADPKNKGLEFEQAAAATGLRAEFLPRDPAVRVAALAHLWVDKTYGVEGLKSAYQKERALFDGRYGEAYRVRILFLRAAVLTNTLNPRTFEDAERELGRLRAEIHGEADFKRLAALRSEDAPSRAREGSFDWVARGDTRLPGELVAKIFPHDDEQIADDRRLIGPVRSQGGVMLAWVGERRASPAWDVMASYVHRELRKRFMDEALKSSEVTTFLDAD
jgi:hypothetical protein